MNGLMTFASNNALSLTMTATGTLSICCIGAYGNGGSPRRGAVAATITTVALGAFLYQAAQLCGEKEPFQATVQCLGLLYTFPTVIVGGVLAVG